MYQIGETVVAGCNGVCYVESIGPLAMMGKAAAGKNYYTLKPCFERGGKVYVPVENEDSRMRPALTKDQAQNLITEISGLEQIWINDEKMRETEYKDAVNSSDPRKLIRIIKTMYYRRKSRIENGKKSTAVDERYFRIAEQRLYDELGLALSMDRDQVKEYIKSHIEKKD